MQVYLVGGAVRDQLLGLDVKERDWVVVGATVEQMLNLGYKQVGKDFPVFLHPQTHEEYALARTERKTGAGYHGFAVHADPSVTLEQDLLRRDLTINAIAQDDNEQLIDPYNGQQDIAQKVLRHVSPAFSEDPVRVLRVARFSARFAEFNVADETMQLMQQMAQNGEMNSAVAERVWQETSRALKEKAPWRFFLILQQSNALEIIMPELTARAIDEARIKNFCQHKISSSQLWALILYCLQIDPAMELCKRLRVPSKYAQLSKMLCQHATMIINAKRQNAEDLLRLLLSCDALRRPDRFNELLETVIALDETLDHDNIAFLKNIASELKKLSPKDIINRGLSGDEIAAEIKQARIEKINQLLN